MVTFTSTGQIMNDWQRYLSSQGAVINDDQIHFHESPTDFQALLAEDDGIMSPLLHQGLISVKGPDAARFLQGQITSDVLQLAVGESTSGARCNAKGRMLASFVLFHAENQHFFLQLHRSLITPLIDELTKYAVFFKVELSDISDRYCLLGSAGKSDEKISLTDTAYQYPLADGRKIFIVSAEKVPSVWEALRDTVKPVGTELWQLMDIRSGLGHVEVDTVDLFIPQMLNLQERLLHRAGSGRTHEVFGKAEAPHVSYRSTRPQGSFVAGHALLSAGPESICRTRRIYSALRH